MLEGQDAGSFTLDQGGMDIGVSGRRGGLDVRYSADHQMIQIDCHGIWTPMQVDACFEELRALMSDMRSRLNRVRILVDRRQAVAQPDATTERLRRHTERDYLPTDRVAVVVDSSLAKSQIRPQLDPITHKLFLSTHAASTWLSAHD